MYVPAFYDVAYKEDGTIASFEPNEEGVPPKIIKQIQMDLTNTYYPSKPVVPFMKITQDRVTLEIQRGCIRGCRFCQAGQLLSLIHILVMNQGDQRSYHQCQPLQFDCRILIAQ